MNPSKLCLCQSVKFILLYALVLLFNLHHFQTCTKSQGTAARVLSSKPVAMQQRGCFATLLSSLGLFRFTPGKCQFWKAPENTFRSLHLHKVVGKKLLQAMIQNWLQAAMTAWWNWALPAPPAQGNLGNLKGRLSTLCQWLCSLNAMDLDTEEKWGEEYVALTSSFLPLSSCVSSSPKPHRTRASIVQKEKNGALDPELSIFVFLWNQLDAVCLQLKIRRDCNGSEWKWPMSAQYHTVDNFQNRDDLLVYHRARRIMGFQFNVIKCHHKHEILKPSINIYN